MAFWIGLYPKPFFQILEQPVNHTIAMCAARTIRNLQDCECAQPHKPAAPSD